MSEFSEPRGNSFVEVKVVVASAGPPAEQVVNYALEPYRGVVGILDSRKSLSDRRFARRREELCWILYTGVFQHIVNKKFALHQGPSFQDFLDAFWCERRSAKVEQLHPLVDERV